MFAPELYTTVKLCVLYVTVDTSSYEILKDSEFKNQFYTEWDFWRKAGGGGGGEGGGLVLEKTYLVPISPKNHIEKYTI